MHRPFGDLARRASCLWAHDTVGMPPLRYTPPSDMLNDMELCGSSAAIPNSVTVGNTPCLAQSYVDPRVSASRRSASAAATS